MNRSSCSLSWLLALVLAGLAGCKDSGHSLGDSRDLDARAGDAPVASGGSTGASTFTQAGHSGNSGVSSGGAGGNPGGGSSGVGGASGAGGGASVAKDAGISSEAGTGACGYRGDSCATRPCCGSLVCMNSTNPPSCYESMPPPRDAGVSDTRESGDSKCPACPLMKCTYGSPVGSDGCTLCECNPAPDGGFDTAPRCPSEGCLDADLSTPCPASPPTQGSSCLGQTVCNYEDCPGSGHTQAMCRSDKWVVVNGACGTVICLGANLVGRTCPVNKVCLVRAGGALLVDCIDNPCGSGLLSADCSTMTTGCTPLLSTSSGVTFYCETTCPNGICA